MKTIAAKNASAYALALLSSEPELHVHSQYEHTVNLALGEQALIALQTEGCPEHPFSITLPLDKLPVLDPAEACRIQGSAIHFVKSDLSIDLSGARGRSFFLRPRAPGAPVWPLYRLREQLKNAVTGSPLAFLAGLGPESPLSFREAHLRAFLDCAALRDSAGILRCVSGLFGLGWGLTPSFDDFFVGYLAASRFFCPGSGAFWSDMGPALEETAFHCTTRISCNFISYACRGMFSAPILDLARAVRNAHPGQIAAAVRRTAALGHTSGRDTLAGFLCGMEREADLSGDAGDKKAAR